MAALSKIIRSLEGGGLAFHCPGCNSTHMVRVGDGPGPRWGWNGDAERPTFTPSILVRGVVPLTDDQHADVMLGDPVPEPIPTVCHSFVTDGRIQYLGDCTHGLAGQTVDLPPWPRETD